ncbi:MAG: 1-acyl-sn-glycerol-3-phosphate acyltransferase [Muribaculum sp.]|nr:1-acyl-sn-glycerol-3-phosphate acyltransferase [Muribaculaceae bacterium]MCM1080938.1 1-acyl-sn-glycerol-3-phosphate acyltransferase [Muribaculum sp.]
MNLSKLLLRIFGWRVEITTPDYPKCLICVAPHTSNWDFVLGELAYRSIGRKAGFLMKEQWFKGPLGVFFRALGGIPVKKQRGSSLTDVIVEKYNSSERLSLAITPEGTRSRTSTWRHGFLHIALQANVPLLLGAIDYKRKYIEVKTEFVPTADIDADMKAVKKFYSQFNAKYPEKFSTDDE